MGKGKVDETERGNWSNQIDFFLSCVGYAVGLGNLWRFPYLCMRNGGGAFLIPYFSFLLLCGVPLFYMELAFGQFSALSPLTIWKASPLFKGLGWAALIVTAICCIYYNMIIAWVLYYLGHSFTWELPWGTCSNSWNSENCYTRKAANVTINASSEQPLPGYGDLGNASMQRKTAAEEFWQYQVLELSPGLHQLGGIRWQLLLSLIGASVIVFLALIKGVKSSGKVVYVTATVPYVFLTILFVRGITLPGSMDGIRFYIVPDFEKLKDYKVWVEACVQIFYSLGPAWGGLITMASYNRFHHNCLRDAILISFINCGTSFYGGFVIFSVLGFMANEVQIDIDKVVTQGPGLAFIAYPEAVTHLPFPSVWAVLFFIMLLTLGLDTQFTMVETLASAIIDLFPKILTKRRMIFTFCLCTFNLLLGLPLVTRGGMYVFQLLDWYCALFSVMFIAFLECVAVAYVYGVNRFCSDIEMMIGRHFMGWWKVCWCAVTPGLIFGMICITCSQVGAPSYGRYQFPGWAIAVGWCVALVSVVPIPTFAILAVLGRRGSLLQRLKELTQPEPDWGPALPKYQREYRQKWNTADKHYDPVANPIEMKPFEYA